MVFFRIGGDSPNFKCLNIFRTQTTWAFLRKYDVGQKAPLNVSWRRCLPTPCLSRSFSPLQM